jgi:hypothetical protein
MLSNTYGMLSCCRKYEILMEIRSLKKNINMENEKISKIICIHVVERKRIRNGRRIRFGKISKKCRKSL